MANNHRTIGNVLRGVFNRICFGIARIVFPAQLRMPFYKATGMKIGKIDIFVEGVRVID